MSGNEIKTYIRNRDDIYYNIIVVDEKHQKISFDEIDSNSEYDFEKIDEFTIGCGMVIAYYSITKNFF